jgi:hypothetical protein
MRALWRKMAARWLGGRASDTLTGNPALSDVARKRHNPVAPAVLVRRQPEASHRRVMRQEQDNTGRDTTAEPLVGSEPDI